MLTNTIKPFYPLTFLLLLFGLLALTTPATAHDDSGQMRLEGVEIEGYSVNIWTYPIEMYVGDIEVEAVVKDSRTMVTCVQCSITVTVASASIGYEETVKADQVGMFLPSDQFFNAKFTLEDEGDYLVTVGLTAPDGATGEVGFEMNVPRQSEVDYWTNRIVEGGLIVGAIWFVIESARTLWMLRKNKPEEV